MRGGTGVVVEYLPQLWDVASVLEPQPGPAEVADLAAAEHAGVTLADRVRGSRGQQVRIRLVTGTPVLGLLVAVFGDGLVLEDPPVTWVIRLASITVVEAGLRAPAPAHGRERGSVRSAVRQLLERDIVVATGDQMVERVRLVAVAADHLLVSAARSGQTGRLIPWSAVWWIRSG